MATTPKNQGTDSKTPIANNLAPPSSGANRAPRPNTAPRPNASRGRLTERDDYISPLSMTGIRTGLLNSTLTKAVLGLLILIFAGTFLLGGLAGRAPQLGRTGSEGARGSGPDPVAQAAGEDIPRARFEQMAQGQQQQMAMFGQTIGPAELLGMRKRTLQELSSQAAQYQAAQAAGISVSDAQVDAKIDTDISEQIKQQQGDNPANFRRMMEAKGQTEQALRDEMRPQFDREAVRRQLMIDKLEQNFKEANKVTEADYKKSVTKLNLRQIVIRPKAPAPTDKDPKAADKAIAEARARADKIVAQLKPLSAGALSAQFAKLATTQSDDAATKAKGGAVGFKTLAELSIPTGLRDALSNATTDLVGPLQDETSPTRDFTIFLIQGRQLELPKDYAKQKAQLLKDYETQRDNDAWSAQVEKIAKAAPVEIYDPALAAYKIQSEQLLSASGADADKLRRDALTKYEEALGFAGGAQAAAIHYQMAHLFGELKQPDKQVENLQAAVKGSENAIPIRLELARALREAKKPKEAVAQLQEASKQVTDNPPAPSMFSSGGNPADALRFQISSEFEAAGRKDLATAERAKIAPPQGAPGMSGLPPGMQLPPGVSLAPGSGAPPSNAPSSAPSAAEFGGKAPVPPPPANARPTTSRPASAPSATRRTTGSAPGTATAVGKPPVSAPARP